MRDLRKDAGLTGRQLASLAGWHGSTVSKIEHGRQTPTEEDIRVWCQCSNADDQIADLVATARTIEVLYVEWQRKLRTGTRRRQRTQLSLEAETRLMRWYEPVLVPGILQTAEYAAEVLARVIDFYEVPNDLEAGLATRMQRQQILYSGDHRFHFIVAHQALRTSVGDSIIMVGQLDRLLNVLSLPRVSLGIVPAASAYRAPSNQFIMFDNRVVHVETVSAELTVAQPRETALYLRAFQALSELAVYGQDARALITAVMADHQAHRRRR